MRLDPPLPSAFTHRLAVVVAKKERSPSAASWRAFSSPAPASRIGLPGLRSFRFQRPAPGLGSVSGLLYRSSSTSRDNGFVGLGIAHPTKASYGLRSRSNWDADGTLPGVLGWTNCTHACGAHEGFPSPVYPAGIRTALENGSGGMQTPPVFGCCVSSRQSLLERFRSPVPSLRSTLPAPIPERATLAGFEATLVRPAMSRAVQDPPSSE